MALPDPSVPSVLPPLAGLISPVQLGFGTMAKAAEGAIGLAGRVADLTGLGGITGKVEESISRIRDFATDQVDALLHGAVSAARATAEFARETYENAMAETSGAVDPAVHAARQLALEIGEAPARASLLLENAEQIKKKALHRRDVLKERVTDIRNERLRLPPNLIKHVEEFSLEIEEEIELDAAAAEDLGLRIERDSRDLYEKTVRDAEFYGTSLASQTQLNFQRSQALKRELGEGIFSAKTWAGNQVRKVELFRSARVEAARSIADPLSAKRWATDSLTGAHQMAAEIQGEAAAKPAEIRSFGMVRVQEAMQLAQALKQEVNTARGWAVTQAGHTSVWKRAMAEHRRSAEAFLEGQAGRIQMKVEQHGSAIVDAAESRALAETYEAKVKAKTAAQKTKKTLTEEFPAVEGGMGPEPVFRQDPIQKHKSLEFDVPEEPDPNPLTSPSLDLPLQPKAKPAEHQESVKPTSSSKATQPQSGKTQVKKEQEAQPLLDVEKETVLKPEIKGQPPVSSPKAKPATGESNVVAKIEEAPPAAAGPVPVPYPNVAQAASKDPVKVHSKVARGETPPPIALPKKEMPKLGGQQPTSAAPAPTPTSSPSVKPPGSPDSPSAATAVKSKGNLAKAGEVAKSEPKQSAPKLAQTLDSKRPQPVAESVVPRPQRKAAASQGPVDAQAFRNSLVQASGQGEAPDSSTRQEIGRHVGFDPSMVRFHTGPSAQVAARALSADAFTIGRDIFFGAGKFDPRTAKGLGLIGHEITHVGQQLGLKGNKMQFATKTGGDAMEQEAQEVGERIATNLAYASSLRVSRFIRTYEPADDEPLTAGVSIRLDRLSMIALKKAGQMLSTKRRSKPLRLDEVVVDLVLDLESLSDQEAVDIWAEAIVAAVEIAEPRTPSRLSAEEMVAPATHLLQRRLGDDVAEPAKLPEPKIDPDVLARLVKITPSPMETGMIRKLLVRRELDPLIKQSQAKQWADDISGSWSVALGLGLPSMSGEIHDDDLAAIEAKLGEYEIGSYRDYLRLQKEFVECFHAKGMNITKYLLEESFSVVKQQKEKYSKSSHTEPDSPLNSLRNAAKEVEKASQIYIDALNGMDVTFWLRIGSQSYSPHTGNLDSVTDKIHEEGLGELFEKKLQEPYKRYMKVRQSQGDKHPILLGRDFDPKKITSTSSNAELENTALEHLNEVEESINDAYGRLTEDKFWELHPMIAMTKSQMGVREGEGADKTIKEFQEDKANDEIFWSILQAGAAIALAVTAMVATGGLAAVAMVGSGALSIYSAAKAYDDYMFKSAAVNSSLDQAKLISKEDPTLFWLALELVGVGLDIGPAVGAFGKLSRIAKAAVSDAGKLKELDSIARGVFRDLPPMNMSEDDFVKRLLDTAAKGVDAVVDAEKFAGQVKLLSELLEGTSPRAVAILKGDTKAIADLVKEHGNWRGLIGGLNNGGNDASLMASNIGKWRNDIVADLKFKFGDTLPGATDDIASDFDINIKDVVDVDGKVVKPAGQNLIDLEAEMVAKYGDNWQEALHMNFYTDASRLLAVDDVLSLVAPAKRAAIMKRVTAKAEKLNFAKMAAHAKGSRQAEAQVLQLMEEAGVKFGIEDLFKLADEIEQEGRDSLLKRVDELMADMNKLPPKDPRRVHLAEEITERQMEANYLMKEAYISPSAVKAGGLNQAEAYQSALSQLEMMSHVISECGGDILKACREYELFKYISRYTAAARSAGVKTPGLTYFEGLSNYIYKRARSAHMETGHLPGVTPADEALEQAVDPEFLIKTYNDFREEVANTLPDLKKAADTNPTGGWKPRPADPKPKYGPAVYSGPENLYVPKPMDPKKAAALPSAAIQTAHKADKIMSGKGMKQDYIYGDMEMVKSAGFKSSRANEGFGVFKGRVRGIAGEVWVTVLPESERGKFENQLAAALAAEKSGFGPKVHGKVDLGEKKLAFATSIVEGGFGDDFNDESKAGAFTRTGKNRMEMLAYASKITPQTFVDVDAYREAIWENGYFYWDHPQGYVTPDGRWKPVNFTGVTPIDKETELGLARTGHDIKFDLLKQRLMEYHVEAKRNLGK